MKFRYKTTQLVIYPKGCKPWLGEGWLPCEHPERPVDNTAAVKHVLHGQPCRSCDIAWEAVGRQADAAIRRAEAREDAKP